MVVPTMRGMSLQCRLLGDQRQDTSRRFRRRFRRVGANSPVRIHVHGTKVHAPTHSKNKHDNNVDNGKKEKKKEKEKEEKHTKRRGERRKRRPRTRRRGNRRGKTRRTRRGPCWTWSREECNVRYMNDVADILMTGNAQKTCTCLHCNCYKNQILATLVFVDQSIDRHDKWRVRVPCCRVRGMCKRPSVALFFSSRCHQSTLLRSLLLR